jgi:hypothetical protein
MKPKCNWGILRFRLAVALLASLVLSAACAPAQGIKEIGPQDVPVATGMIAGTSRVPGQIEGTASPAGAAPGCPKLVEPLKQLVQSSDPQEAAKALSLPLKDGKVQVVLVLTSEKTDFLKDFEVEIGSQAGNQVQAYVAIAQLCQLAQREQVQAIRIPGQVFLP